MKIRQMIAMALLAMSVTANASNYSASEYQTANMLMTYTRYIQKTNDTTSDMSKAMQVCIVLQMREAGCKEIQDHVLFNMLKYEPKPQ